MLPGPSRNRSFVIAAVLALLVNAPLRAQPDGARLQVERAAAKEVRRETIAKQFKSARYRFAVASWDEPGGWKADRSRADAEAIAKDLKIPVASDDQPVVECERPRTNKPCGIAGEGSIVTLGTPVFLGDSARIAVSLWFWTPAADRVNDRFPDRPGGAIHYLVVRERANVWRVARVLHRTIK